MSITAAGARSWITTPSSRPPIGCRTPSAPMPICNTAASTIASRARTTRRATSTCTAPSPSSTPRPDSPTSAAATMPMPRSPWHTASRIARTSPRTDPRRSLPTRPSTTTRQATNTPAAPSTSAPTSTIWTTTTSLCSRARSPRLARRSRRTSRTAIAWAWSSAAACASHRGSTGAAT